MEPIQLDDVDRGILHALQEDARNATADEMAEQVGVSASTVRNRIGRLEEAGVIRGYHPEIDYGRANFQLFALIVCRAATSARKELVEQILEFDGVVTVRELLTGVDNLHVQTVATDSDDMDETVGRIDELDLEIVSTELIKRDHRQPFDHFGVEVIEE